MSEFRVTKWRTNGDGMFLDIAGSGLSLSVKMDTLEARKIALAVLAHQGEHLRFAPPNPSMREAMP